MATDPAGTAAPDGRADVIARVLQLVIRAYQVLLSPIAGGACRFTPSCSAYALEALEKHGAWKGGLMAVRRVARCHPWGPAGFDPVR